MFGTIEFDYVSLLNKIHKMHTCGSMFDIL